MITLYQFFIAGVSIVPPYVALELGLSKSAEGDTEYNPTATGDPLSRNATGDVDYDTGGGVA